jgi:neutral ceramidase
MSNEAASGATRALTAPFEAGLSKVDITCFEDDMVMMGWGRLDQRVRGVGAPLHARALVLCAGTEGADDDAPPHKVALVVAELLFISVAVRRAVVDRLSTLGWSAHQVVLAATHTHSGPSGFSHYLGHNATSFGFSEHVFSHVVDGIVRAVCEADARRTPAILRVASATIPLDEPVAFNRSPLAYLQNRDVAPIDLDHPEQATDRESTTLRIDATDGRPLGAVNWFGVHGSNLHADHQLLHPDNKGLAAAAFEAELAGDNPRFVALFAQESAGDASPNFRHDARRGIAVGTRDDDLESARENADIQLRYARAAWRQAEASAPLEGRIACAVEHVDFGRACAGRAWTAPPELGLGIAAGTDEGPGPLHPFAPLLRRLSRLLSRVLPGQRDAKLSWMSTDRGAEGRFLGVIPMRLGLRIIALVEPRIAYVKAADDAGVVGDAPWFPRVLPVQIVWLGGLVLGLVPFEPTTVAGRRLRARLRRITGADRVVVTSYANGYGGYLTTSEEYRVQHYEGAATYYGEHTFDAVARALEWLARTRGIRPRSGVFGPALAVLDEDMLAAQRRVGDAYRQGHGP